MPQLLCTVRSCHLPLNREKSRVICPRGHAFDIARSGYINLLQPQERRSRNPGDSAEAVAARRRFLDRGHAEPLLSAIRSMLPRSESILDAGCGEGYYLGSLAIGSGIDISTTAIDLAARRYPRCEWIVANADRFIPYSDASFDVVLSITGRMNAEEFRRVCRGHLLIAVAAPDDLHELRGSRGRDRVPRTIATFADGFQLVKQERATTIAHLTAADARDILAATYRPREGFRSAGVPPAGPPASSPAATTRRRDGGEPAGQRPALRSITLSFDLLLFAAEKRGSRDRRTAA